jgi:outer membrane protein assembly factor BamE (lipoprotein component of BamABCDE complex)
MPPRALPLAFALALFAAACGAQLTFDRARAQTITRGMTREQVRSLLGPPMYVFLDMPNPQNTTESWRYVDNASAPPQTLDVHFDGAAVVVVNGP